MSTVAQVFVPGFSISGQWVPCPSCGSGEPYAAMQALKVQEGVRLVRLYCANPDHRWEAIRVYLQEAQHEHE